MKNTLQEGVFDFFFNRGLYLLRTVKSEKLMKKLKRQKVEGQNE